jgi:hypothetical protein
VSFCLSKGHELVYCQDDVLIFDVRDSAAMRDAWYGKWAGVIRPALEWMTETLGDGASRPYGPPRSQ